MIGAEQLEDKLGEIVTVWGKLEKPTQLAAGNIDVKTAKRVNNALVVCWAVGDIDIKYLTFSSRLVCGNLGLLLAVPKGQGRGRFSRAIAGLDAVFSQDELRIIDWGGEAGADRDDLSTLTTLVNDEDLDFGEILSETGEPNHMNVSRIEEVRDGDSAWMVRNVVIPAALYLELE